MWDAIVIGSGMGGLGAAAALARQGRRILVLEQHSVTGGLTQTFRRGDWTFATGVHYIGGVGPIAGPDDSLAEQRFAIFGRNAGCSQTTRERVPQVVVCVAPSPVYQRHPTRNT